MEGKKKKGLSLDQQKKAVVGAVGDDGYICFSVSGVVVVVVVIVVLVRNGRNLETLIRKYSDPQ